MQTFKTTILVASLAALAGCASYVKQADVCVDQGGTAMYQRVNARMLRLWPPKHRGISPPS